MRAGRCWVNTTIVGGPEQPMGGFKRSGTGRECGMMGVEEYTETKSIHIALGDREHWVALRWHGYQPERRKRCVRRARLDPGYRAGPWSRCVDGDLLDITSRKVPTMRDLWKWMIRRPPLREHGPVVGSLADLETESLDAQSDPSKRHLLAPNDLQAVKAAGVTFAKSMVERVIEERAAGDPQCGAGHQGSDRGTHRGEPFRHRTGVRQGRAGQEGPFRTRGYGRNTLKLE
jgi:hypothetical protein